MTTQFGSARRPAFFRRTLRRLGTFALVLGLVACEPAQADAPLMPSITASTPEDAGRYIVAIAGCNDCHTDGFMETNGQIPEAERLTGSVLGWRGPWGTTYPPNLRLTAQNMTEDQWVEMLGTREGLPPMPWPSVNSMSDSDRRAVYRYLRHLGPAGGARSAAVPPGVEPQGPWIDMDVKGIPAAASAATGS